MIRTRKRDDDSHHNNSITSDGASLAFDASSMSATGSRSSLTFSSSKKKQQQRPRKRYRKTLSDALQSISLDRDVPQQILKMKDFPFSKSVAFTNVANTANDWTYNHRNNLNSQQRLDRQLDQHGNRQANAGGDGDIYYDDDDNSQLTSSSDENAVDDRVIMDDEEDDDDENEDDDEDRQLKKESAMTEIEKAQRKVMFELVFGKNHREARKSTGRNASSLTRETGSRVATPPPIRIVPDSAAMLSPPPLATVSTRTVPGTNGIITAKGKTLIRTIAKQDHDDDQEVDRYKDPVDRKIEELLRRSLQNLQKGSHPLALPRLDTANDEDVCVATPWKTQDDMAIDPEIYSRRVASSVTSSSSMQVMTDEEPTPMAARATPMGQSNAPIPNSNLMTPNSSTIAATTNNTNVNWASQCEPNPFSRKRSNSLPGGFELGNSMLGTTDMEMDN